jgi:hypothetical protein
MLKTEVHLKIVIHDRKTFIVQATGHFKATTFLKAENFCSHRVT